MPAMFGKIIPMYPWISQVETKNTYKKTDIQKQKINTIFFTVAKILQFTLINLRTKTQQILDTTPGISFLKAVRIN